LRPRLSHTQPKGPGGHALSTSFSPDHGAAAAWMVIGALSMPGAAVPNLNATHQSKIRITLTLLDEALVKFEEWAKGREVHSLLYQETNTLDAKIRTGMLADIACIRNIVQELQHDLHLEATPQDIIKTIRAQCYILWVDVLEMTGKYLRGFGEPPPELVDYLDPKAQRILQYLDHIKALLTKSTL
jgi:hypothetical protein